MARAQTSFLVKTRGGFRNHLGVPSRFHRWGSGCPSADPFFLCRCHPDEQEIPAETQEKPNANCRTADLARAQEQCQTALQAPAWAKCASHVVLRPFLLSCTNNVCQFGGLNHALCESLESFGAACRAKGLKPPIWRNSSFFRECPQQSLQTLPHLVSVSVSLKAPCPPFLLLLTYA